LLSRLGQTASATGENAAVAAAIFVLAAFLAGWCLGDDAPEQAREDAHLDLPAPRYGPPRRLLLLLPLHRRCGWVLAHEGTGVWGLESRVACVVLCLMSE